MPRQDESPAVQSLRNEQRRQQRKASPSELDKALEDTFPASDPLSTTQTAVSGPTVSDGADEERPHGDRFEQSASVDMQRESNVAAPSGDQIPIDQSNPRLRLGSPSALDPGRNGKEPFPKGQAGGVDGVTRWARERPIATILAAAAIGFAFGIIRVP
jgi:hypothetical protein